MVSRMVGMKGFDLVQSIADGLVDRGIELVILGSGENQYETFFSDLCARHPGRVGTYIGFELSTVSGDLRRCRRVHHAFQERALRSGTDGGLPLRHTSHRP